MKGHQFFSFIVNQPYLYCPDPMHDFFEGDVISKVLNPFLTIHIKKTSELLNNIEFENGSIKINKKNDMFQISGKGILNLDSKLLNYFISSHF